MTAYEIAATLPTIPVLRSRCVALAALDRIVDGGDDPHYTFTRAWGDAEAALMSNGSGDEWAVVFSADGAFIRVFDHESAMSPYRDEDREPWPGLLDGLPTTLHAQVTEPAFGDGKGRFLATAVLWRQPADDRWHAGEGIVFPPARGPYDTDPDGTGLLTILLDDMAGQYVDFAADYYERPVSREAVAHVIDYRPLTDAVVRALNPDTTVAEVREALEAIGYLSAKEPRRS